MTDLPPDSQPTPPVEPPAYAQPSQPSQPAPGYSMPGQPAPAYGQAYAPGYVAPARTNTLAIVSLILSLAGIFVPGASIAAIVTGHISLGQIKRTGEAGHGLGLAGTVIGYVVTGLGILAIIAYVVFIVILVGAGAASGSFDNY